MTSTSSCQGLSKNSGMIITTLEGVTGKEIIKHFGLVQNSTICAKHVGKDIMASFNNLVGRKLKSYTELLQEARKGAL